MPVATTDTRMRPSMSSRMVLPKMMLASGSTSARMRLAACSTSNSIRSGPPVMLISTPLAPFIGDIVEQRIGDRHVGGAHGAVFAFGLAGAHHRLAHLGDHRLDVGEVEIDQAGHHDQVGDAAHAGMQHLVGHGEGLGEGGAVVGDAEQVLVRDDDQGMDELLQFLDAAFGHAHAAVAFQAEGLGDDADGQDAGLAHGARDDGGRAGAGAAAHAGGDEHHVRARKLLHDLGHGFFGAGAADFRLGARAQAFGGGGAKLDAALALDWARAWASVLATTKSTPSRPASIMLLTALPPAPPTPSTVMRGRSSLVSGAFRLIVIVWGSPYRTIGSITLDAHQNFPTDSLVILLNH